MQKIFLLGSGQQAKCTLEAVRAQGLYEVVGLIDSRTKDTVLPVPVVGTDEERDSLARRFDTRRFIVAVGDIPTRVKLFENYVSAGWEPVNVIHPSVILGSGVTLGRGILIEAGSVLTPDPVLGDNLLINPLVAINHDCVIGDHCHLATGMASAGRVHIGARSLIGTGASLCPGVEIGPDSIVGAGAVVTKDLPGGETYAGVPARPLHR